MKKTLSFLILTSFALLAEPSAFNAGGNEPPKTKEQIAEERLFNLSTRLKALEESQEGLKSIFEGQMRRTQENSIRVNQVFNESNATISKVTEHVDSNFALQNENLEKMKESILALGALVEKNNQQLKEEIANIKEELEALKEAKNSSKAENKKEAKEEKIEVKVSKMEPSKAYLEGEKLFAEGKYNEASIYFKYTIEKLYKPAKSNYLMGEIAFFNKQYEDAIFYYKTSATRYDKADYMPNLMLNSAKSFQSLGQTENAKNFLDTLIALYPDSKEAKEAKKLLN
ncbi:tetratricopeptide repeat protein [Helicobacter burdigaliensis]|uniref:tetratricopeptide repeat protein n=1 Tax=Helicobacter burdigaliensis TaxID=2315334 RepID=UPI000EF691B8|nr:tetratricopeptide repeat protein [Helicobacter burdigaliensis]